nr:unnamed protein product [Spirometra erinaceieuropaei]
MKPGRVHWPTLFSLMFTAMSMGACRDERSIVGGCISTRAHPQLPSMNAITDEDIQRGMGLFATVCDNFGPIINMEKTVIMHQPPSDAANVVCHINVNSARLKAMDNVTFQGSTLSYNIQNRRRGDPSPAEQNMSDVPSSDTIINNTPTSGDVDSVPTCPHCDRPFTSHIGLVGHFRIHRQETGEPVPGALTLDASLSTALTAATHAAISRAY